MAGLVAPGQTLEANPLYRHGSNEIREKLLRGEIVSYLREAQVRIEACHRPYNTVQPSQVKLIQPEGLHSPCTTTGGSGPTRLPRAIQQWSPVESQARSGATEVPGWFLVAAERAIWVCTISASPASDPAVRTSRSTSANASRSIVLAWAYSALSYSHLF